MNEQIAQEVAQVFGGQAQRASTGQWIVTVDGYFVGIINAIQGRDPQEAVQT